MTVYRIIRIFAIDIAAGAVAGTLLMADLLDIKLNFSYLLILFLATIIIYSGDHLVDGFRKKGRSEKEAHRLFYRFRKPVVVAMIFLAVFVLRLAFYSLERKMIEFGLILGGFVLVYFLLNAYYQRVEKVIFVKELWICLLYCFAVVGGPLVIYGLKPDSAVLLLLIAFGFMVLSNVLIYSYYEYDTDLRDREKTLATSFGKDSCRIIIYISLALSAGILSSSFLVSGEITLYFYLIFLSMEAILLWIILDEKRFSVDGRFGQLADAVFLLPFLHLLF